MSASTAPLTDAPLTTKQRVGLVLAGVYGLVNLPSVVTPTPDGDAGPPFPIVLLDTLLGAVCVVAVVLAWRGSRVAQRICAGAMVVLVLTALPAFFVDVPAPLKAVVGATVLLVVVSVALIFSGPRQSE